MQGENGIRRAFYNASDAENQEFLKKADQLNEKEKSELLDIYIKHTNNEEQIEKLLGEDREERIRAEAFRLAKAAELPRHTLDMPGEKRPLNVSQEMDRQLPQAAKNVALQEKQATQAREQDLKKQALAYVRARADERQQREQERKPESLMRQDWLKAAIPADAVRKAREEARRDREKRDAKARGPRGGRDDGRTR